MYENTVNIKLKLSGKYAIERQTHRQIKILFMCQKDLKALTDLFYLSSFIIYNLIKIFLIIKDIVNLSYLKLL